MSCNDGFRTARASSNILDKVGNTPLISICLDEFRNVNFFAKLESYNPTGSVKDRAASFILETLLESKVIDRHTTIIESSSGNFGVALSVFCKRHKLRFIAVVDSNITGINEMLIRSQGAEVIKVNEPDKHGGYLLTRIEKVCELKKEIDNCYWVNQYENPLNARAYYTTLGKELCSQIDDINYIFLGVSSGGTLTGVSQIIKETFPNAKVVAVDVDGSLIFSDNAKKRFIPGIGSSMVPKILRDARIDEVVITDEVSSINACYELLQRHSLFVGGSSGSAYAGVRKYFSNKIINTPINVVTVFPDRGERYFDTIYNKAWCERILALQNADNSILLPS